MSKIGEYVEALIFSYGDGIQLGELAKKTKSDELIIKKAVSSLNKVYQERKSAFYIVSEGNLYRMRLRPDLAHLVQDRLQTDMGKGVLMTLSMIAVNKKMKQADLVKRRGSIVYQHLKELKSRGFVNVTEEDGHKVVKISPSFYDYFDVDAKEFKDLTDSIKDELSKEQGQTVEYVGN